MTPPISRKFIYFMRNFSSTFTIESKLLFLLIWERKLERILSPCLVGFFSLLPFNSNLKDRLEKFSCESDPQIASRQNRKTTLAFSRGIPGQRSCRYANFLAVFANDESSLRDLAKASSPSTDNGNKTRKSWELVFALRFLGKIHPGMLEYSRGNRAWGMHWIVFGILESVIQP